MELTLKEVKPLLKYIIKNNVILQNNNKLPIAVNLCGKAGLGKTALVEQVANELNANYICLNLAQLTDPSELCGWPIKEHYVCKGDDCKWITGELIEAYTKAGYTITEETRMGYAIPAWLKGLDINKPTICVLDDYTRCSPALLQAVMEITYKQQYISWKLPYNSHIILTTNPDNGAYNVNSFDLAQATRFITFNIKFDVNSWAQWAESQYLDTRSINFLLYNPEILKDKDQVESKINARNYTMFSNIISGIPDWSSTENLSYILQIASGCFPDDTDIIGSLFTAFIANKLDKLPTPEDLIHKDWKSIKNKLEDILYDNNKYRADIASVITTRFINYSLICLEQKEFKFDIVIDRIIEIVESDKLLLSDDLLFSMIRTLNKKFPGKCHKLLLNAKIVKKLL